ncbi:MAG TPA: hypothetical protein VHZ30_05150 [Verrucomicrobiae bacterium]|nr:hypothetical protein [Verrucomicrobiae bacterium]
MQTNPGEARRLPQRLLMKHGGIKPAAPPLGKLMVAATFAICQRRAILYTAPQ